MTPADRDPPEGAPSRRSRRDGSAPKKHGTGKKRTKKAKKRATTPEPKRGRGRPPKTPTADQIAQVERMAQLGLNYREMALLLDMHPETFAKYRPDFFDTAIAKGTARGKMASGLVLFREMQKGNLTALIWFEKTRHGMTEKTHQIISDPNGNPLPPAQVQPGVAIFLPPNGRDVPAEGQEIPAQYQIQPASEAPPNHDPADRPDPQ